MKEEEDDHEIDEEEEKEEEQQDVKSKEGEGQEICATPGKLVN